MTISKSDLEWFKESLNGHKGQLDAWLEVNNEEEVRAAINALVAEQKSSCKDNPQASEDFNKNQSAQQQQEAAGHEQ